MNFLVSGDSWSFLDDKHSHFLKHWAEQNGHTTEHIGRPGSNNVMIASDFLNKDLSNYDAIFYFPADFLRVCLNMLDGKVSNSPFTMNKQKKFVGNFDKLLEYYDDPNKILEVTKPSFYNIQDNRKNVQPNMMINKDIVNASKFEAVDTETFDILSARDFYADIDLDWLCRANYLAMQYTFLNAKIKNIPVIVILPEVTNITKNKELYKDVDFVITFSDLKLEYANENQVSLNHVDRRYLKQYSDSFNTYVQNNIDIKTVLYK